MVGLQRALVALAAFLFAAAAVLAALAVRTFLRDDIRGVVDDLSGRRRAAGLAAQGLPARVATPSPCDVPVPTPQGRQGPDARDSAVPEMGASPQGPVPSSGRSAPGGADRAPAAGHGTSARQSPPAFCVTRRIVLIPSEAPLPPGCEGAEGGTYRYT